MKSFSDVKCKKTKATGSTLTFSSGQLVLENNQNNFRFASKHRLFFRKNIEKCLLEFWTRPRDIGNVVVSENTNLCATPGALKAKALPKESVHEILPYNQSNRVDGGVALSKFSIRPCQSCLP